MRVILKICVALLCLTSFVVKAEEPTSVQKVMDRAETITDKALEGYKSVTNRAFDSRMKHTATALISYSPLDLLLPGKIGVNFAYHMEPDALYEFDYSGSSIGASISIKDIAGLSEQRISLLKRNFFGGAFNWFWGAHHNTSNVHVAPELMNGVGYAGTSDMLDVQTLGASIGFGHRWVYKERFSIGVDWFSWAQPLIIIKKDSPYLQSSASQSDKDKVDTIINVLAYAPRWAAFKFYLGYSF